MRLTRARAKERITKGFHKHRDFAARVMAEVIAWFSLARAFTPGATGASVSLSLAYEVLFQSLLKEANNGLSYYHPGVKACARETNSSNRRVRLQQS